MLVGTLALTGLCSWLFGMAGFYSKDAIVEAAYVSSIGAILTHFMLLVAALMTSFYSWRLIFMTFHGTPRASKEVMSHLHESPNIMLIPLIILVIDQFSYAFYDSFIYAVLKNFGQFDIYLKRQLHIKELHDVSYLIKWS